MSDFISPVTETVRWNICSQDQPIVAKQSKPLFAQETCSERVRKLSSGDAAVVRKEESEPRFGKKL